MEKKTTPALSVVFYIAGIIFLAVSAFMLALAVGYTRTYIESYDATFADMWTNCVQYVIKEFVPYLGIGVICIGIGAAVKEARNSAVTTVSVPVQNRESQDVSQAIGKLEAGLKYLENDIDTTREVLGIKIEEKEKRDTFRLKELEEKLREVLESDDDPGEPIRISVPGVSGMQQAASVKPIPVFRVAQTMAMPDIKSVKATEDIKPAKPIPVFRVAQTMAMPDIDFA